MIECSRFSGTFTVKMLCNTSFVPINLPVFWYIQLHNQLWFVEESLREKDCVSSYLVARFDKTKSCFCTQMGSFDNVSFPACNWVLLQTTTQLGGFQVCYVNTDQ